MRHTPTPVTLSATLLDRFSSIDRLLGRMEGVHLESPVPRLREKNLARSVHGSTGIEGNPLSLMQVEALARGGSPSLPRAACVEVRNAPQAYTNLAQFNPFKEESLLRAHEILMGNGLMLSAGRYREGPVEVYVSKTETLEMPNWRSVEPFMDWIFSDLLTSGEPMLLRSVRFHYEFVNLHPFYDGNGRTARLWQTRLLMEEHPIFEFLDVESMVFEKRTQYYAAIQESQRSNDAAPFILFMLEQVQRSLLALWEDSRPLSPSPSERLTIARRMLNRKTFSRQDYMKLFKSISPVTASRDLAQGVRQEVLRRSGERRKSVYQFLPEEG